MEHYRLTQKRDCIILSVGKFDRVNDRDNAGKDAHRLEKTFKALGFTCYVNKGTVFNTNTYGEKD